MAAAVQREYYTRTADRYDDMHLRPDDEHYLAARYISGFVRQFGFRSLLDVGAGTGRGLVHFRKEHPGLDIRGVEPVGALIEEAFRKQELPPGSLIEADGQALPFDDASFDVTCEFAVLHHAADPGAIVEEMLRVARRAVFLSDDNRFGHGHPLARVVKLGLYRGRLWPLANYIKTNRRGYTISDEDGLAYSYSVYDSLPLLARWANRIFLIPLSGRLFSRWTGPLLTAPTILVCAIRDT